MHEQCDANGRPGVCQASGYCSFEDGDCDSGQRYGDLAPKSLAGTCVPVDGDGSTGPGDPDGSGSAAGTTTGMDPDDASDGLSTTLGVDEGTTDGGESTDDDGTTTGEPACCYAGCPGTCAQPPCEAVPLGGPSGGEAIGVAVVGEWVVWSTGNGVTLRIAALDAEADEVLAPVPGNNFATRIAADDTHVYVLDYGGPTVKRASVPDGAIDLVSQVAGGAANFGSIAVNDEHVYFAMRMSGGIWRAAKDLSDADAAQAVAPAVTPGDVALDDTHVYWTDVEAAQVRRMAFAEVGVAAEGEPVVDAADLTALAVDGERIYYADNDVILSADKAGTNRGIATVATGQDWVWDMVVDDTHVYWTDANVGAIARAPKDASGDAVQLAPALAPWGLDVGCDAVYWANNGDQTLRKRFK
jgi:hypothetical protein